MIKGVTKRYSRADDIQIKLKKYTKIKIFTITSSTQTYDDDVQFASQK